MTAVEQDAIIGRVIREEKENSLLLATLESKMRQLADEYGQLRHALHNDPESISFSGESCNPQTQRIFADELFDSKQLRLLLTDYKTAVQQHATLDKELKRLGVRPEPIAIIRP